MGVQGLTTYVEGNGNFLQHVKFRDSRLVIDGCSLYFRLYFTHSLDQQHGGDYDAFSCLLSEFFSTLAECNIQPYVVLDGGKDTSELQYFIYLILQKTNSLHFWLFILILNSKFISFTL